MAKSLLFRSVETAAAITDRVLVSFSGGKDSVVTLDLCMRFFKHVEAFFMYQVRGLSFQEAILHYYEDKYSIPIYRIPHFELSEFLRYGLYRKEDMSVPIVSVKETYDYMRCNTDIYWIAAGERIADSVWRRAMIKHSGTIDEVRGRFYPVAEWTKQNILSYIKQRRLPIGMESAKLGFSFRSFAGKDMAAVKECFPDDYQLIRSWFPLIEASVINYKLKEEARQNGQLQQVSEI